MSLEKRNGSEGGNTSTLLHQLSLLLVRLQETKLEVADEILLAECWQLLREFVTEEAKRYGLTERETEVWQLRQSGSAYKEIAEALNISEFTVKQHLRSIHRKQKEQSLP